MNHVFCSFDVRRSLNVAHICKKLFQANLQAIFSTAVSNYYKEQKIKKKDKVY